MDHIKKTKIKYFLILILLCIVIFGVILTFQKQSIKIIYFRNSGCRVIENTDKILEKIRSDFKEKIVIEYVQVQMYPDDPPDTTRIKQLREKYSIYGVPDIIIK